MNFRRTAIACLLASATATTGALAQDKVIHIDGSSTVFPITQAAAKAFEAKTEGAVEVDVTFSGSSAGFRKFVEGKLDISNASRPINKKEIDKAKAKGVNYIELIVGYDALTVAVSAENDWVKDIKTSELQKLWAPGAQDTVVLWSDIRPEWPKEKIVLYGAGGDSGTFDYFSEVIVGDAKNLRSDYIGSEDDNMIVEGIAKNKYAIGFLPFAYYLGAKNSLRALAIEPDFNAVTNTTVKAHPVEPSVRAVHQGYYVPLGRPLFMYVNVASLETKPYLTDFLNFFLDKADGFVGKAGYMSLSKIAYDKGAHDIKNRVIGTRFAGETITSVPHSDIYTLKQK